MSSKMPRQVSACLGIILLSTIVGIAQSPRTRLPPKTQPVTTKLTTYPPIARAACAQGAVAVLVEVDSQGKVTSTDILYGHPLLTRMAEAAARDWIFDKSSEELGARRDVLRFVFQIMPFEVSEKRLKPIWMTSTDMQIRVHPPEPSCDDCSEKRRKELRRGGCPAEP